MARDQSDATGRSIIPKKPVPDMIPYGYRFSDKIVLSERLPAFVGSE
jgi:hypothetical protein